MNEKTEEVIVFFDSECVVCDASVQFLLKRSQSGLLRYAPLGGEKYEELGLEKLETSQPEEKYDSIISWSDGVVCNRSQAALEIMQHLNQPWRAIGKFLSIFPIRLLDYFYKNFASRRYQWFGELKHCHIRTAEERKQFYS